MDISKEIREKIDFLNQATKAYNEGCPIITDKQWDDEYFQLVQMERYSGIIYNDSPTQTIHYETKDILTKVKHNHEMLSLEKTKDLTTVANFFGDHESVIMCKMDGLTCTLTYKNGELVAAETRGDGIIGEDILHNVKTIPSIPLHIPSKDTFIVDGEIICRTNIFNEYFADNYDNPRNFASGSIRLLSSKESSQRKLTFVAWDVIEGFPLLNTLYRRLAHLSTYGFTVVPFFMVYKESLVEDLIYKLKGQADREYYPIDGMVFKFNDVKYGKSLGKTKHHFKNAIAYKFYDEIYETYLKNIKWTMGRTGVLTPVAIVEPIEIDGTTIERASLHNVSVMNELLGSTPFIGQKVRIFKANQIIPQIDSADLEGNGEPIEIPTVCPICGKEVQQCTENDSTILVCMNPTCDGKLINKLDHYCGKQGMDIKGLSKMTISKLIDNGWLGNYEELYSLSNFRDEWISMPGFGERSVDKVLNAIEASRECELDKFITAIGIPLIGSSAAKELIKYFNTWEAFHEAVVGNYPFYELPNFGYEMYSSLVGFDYEEANRIAMNYLTFKEIKEEVVNENFGIKDKVFVITGTLHNYKNRSELSKFIASQGGRVSTSISGKTDYLINNDINSTSSKNKTAKQMNIPIITEEQFEELISGS